MAKLPLLSRRGLKTLFKNMVCTAYFLGSYKPINLPPGWRHSIGIFWDWLSLGMHPNFKNWSFSYIHTNIQKATHWTGGIVFHARSFIKHSSVSTTTCLYKRTNSSASTASLETTVLVVVAPVDNTTAICKKLFQSRDQFLQVLLKGGVGPFKS